VEYEDRSKAMLLPSPHKVKKKKRWGDTVEKFPYKAKK
jgi:hypothetical protein